jgi:cell division protein YceG involved in septum cleavage
MKSNEFTESNKTNTGETGTDGVNETTVPGEKIATTIRIVISRGDSSLAVSRVLETENLVEDAREFDRFLCDEEYDHSLRVGEHYIPSGATWGEIARIITGAG